MAETIVRGGIDLTALMADFEGAAVKQREGAGNKMFSYVSTDTVIRRLNTATINQWSFEMISVQFLPAGFRIDKYKNNERIEQQIMLVHGRLTIPGLGSRDGHGVQRLDDPIQSGDDLLKAAAGDALKRAAVSFGVAISLYGRDLEDPTIAHEPVAQAPARQAAAGPARQTPSAPARQTPAAQAQGDEQPYPYPKAGGEWDTGKLVNWMRQQGFDGVTDFPTAISEANRYGKDTHGVAEIVIGTGEWRDFKGVRSRKVWPSNVVDALGYYFEKEKMLNAAKDAPTAATPEQLEDEIPF